MTDPKKKLLTGVIDLLRYQTFGELFDSFPAADFGVTDENQLMGFINTIQKKMKHNLAW